MQLDEILEVYEKYQVEEESDVVQTMQTHLQSEVPSALISVELLISDNVCIR